MIKVGIFFGGQSREREVSFAGGRTVYDNLDKSMFDAIPIFVDSVGRFILLDWSCVYKGTIRDFYPKASSLAQKNDSYIPIYIESVKDSKIIAESIQGIGKEIHPKDFAQLMDIAFLTLHGPYGEDGNIQGLLEWFGIPYTGSGVLASGLGISKLAQKKWFKIAGIATTDFETLDRNTWKQATYTEKKSILEAFSNTLGHTFVAKAPHQGSSVGVQIIDIAQIDAAISAVDSCFFIEKIKTEKWKKRSDAERRQALFQMTDVRSGIGFPLWINETILYTPEELDQYLLKSEADEVLLEATDAEQTLLLEKYIHGVEFSCIVIENQDGRALALPPTQIIKSSQVFDYRAKYLPGIARKITPIELPELVIRNIQEACESLFDALQCDVYARIDGFYDENGKIWLNDPNTTSGMLPSSFFFHQAAEIGFYPSQFLTYIIYTSLKARLRGAKHIVQIKQLLAKLEGYLSLQKVSKKQKTAVGVIMGGYSTERHISMESGRNVFEKLYSSTKYAPLPFFLTQKKSKDQNYTLYKLPVNLLLKDNADDIRDKVTTPGKRHPIIAELIEKTTSLRAFYNAESNLELAEVSVEALKGIVQEVFIALHGRPGEDGDLQAKLEAMHIPYNGSGPESSSVTIDKYKTNAILREAGFLVAKHVLVSKSDWNTNPKAQIDQLEKYIGYPMIVKPHDDGCSSAVKKIKNATELSAYAAMIFRSEPNYLNEPSTVIQLKPNEAFPQKDYFLVEELIQANGADKFLEITGGMLFSFDGEMQQVTVFEPSETLSSGDILSLEEKFLAGEGQNITPARFSTDLEAQKKISATVRDTLGKVALHLGVEGYCRIDAFVRIFNPDKVETIIIEINSLPGMTPATCIFHQAAIEGLKPYQFIDRILAYGRSKK